MLISYLHLNCRNNETISLFPWARARCSGVCWDTGVVSPSMRNSAGSPPDGSVIFKVWEFGFPPLSSNTFTSFGRPFSQARCNAVSPWKENKWATSWDYGTFHPPYTHFSNAHAQPSSGAWCLIFGPTLRLLPYFMCANTEGLPKPSLVAYVISTIISWAGSIMLCKKMRKYETAFLV